MFVNLTLVPVLKNFHFLQLYTPLHIKCYNMQDLYFCCLLLFLLDNFGH